MTKPRIVHAFSAGGVVYRPAGPGGPSGPPSASDEARYEVVLVGEPAANIWVLPKGTPLAGETPEETAVREVREETGIEPRVVGELGSIEYWFTRKGTRFKKEVQHFLMQAAGGSVANHDHEYAEARWMPIDEAIERLTHVNEAEIMRRAREELGRHSHKERRAGQGSDGAGEAD